MKETRILFSMGKGFAESQRANDSYGFARPDMQHRDRFLATLRLCVAVSGVRDFEYRREPVPSEEISIGSSGIKLDAFDILRAHTDYCKDSYTNC